MLQTPNEDIAYNLYKRTYYYHSLSSMVGLIVMVVSVCLQKNHRLGGSPNLLYEPAPSIGKWQISIFQRAKTPEPILLKLGMVDYDRDCTLHDNFGGGSATWVVWANM